MTFEPGQKVIYYALTRREVRPVECTVVRLDDDPSWLVIRSPEKPNPIRVKKTSVTYPSTNHQESVR